MSKTTLKTIREYFHANLKDMEEKIAAYRNVSDQTRENLMIRYTRRSYQILLQIFFLLITISCFTIAILLYPGSVLARVTDDHTFLRAFSAAEMFKLVLWMLFVGGLMFYYIGYLIRANIRNRNRTYLLSKQLSTIIKDMEHSVEVQQSYYDYLLQTEEHVNTKNSD